MIVKGVIVKLQMKTFTIAGMQHLVSCGCIHTTGIFFSSNRIFMLLGALKLTSMFLFFPPQKSRSSLSLEAYTTEQKKKVCQCLMEYIAKQKHDQYSAVTEATNKVGIFPCMSGRR